MKMVKGIGGLSVLVGIGLILYKLYERRNNDESKNSGLN